MSSARSPSSSERAREEPPARAGTIRRWLPVLVWAVFISWFSGDAFSARSTHHYIDPIIRFFLGADTPVATIRFVHAIIRKSAHVVEYGVLAVLVCRALAAPGAAIRPAILARALLTCALYASADEIHQTFVLSRTGSPIDVGFDVAGATAGALLLALKRGRGVSGPARGSS